MGTGQPMSGGISWSNKVQALGSSTTTSAPQQNQMNCQHGATPKQ
jgi:hypothetical protein